MGSEVVYQCNSGYHNVGKGNISICTAAGLWERSSVLCQGTVTVSSDLQIRFTDFFFFFFLGLIITMHTDVGSPCLSF